MVMLDTLVAGICDGSVLDDIDFELLAHNNDDNKKLHSKVHILYWIMGT